MAIINTIDELKETVRVNKDAPFGNLKIFLNDARDYFLTHYLGDEIISKLENTDTSESKYITILPMVRRVLGPYAIMLSTDELSINTGDNGHTVTKTDRLAPASDAKIAKASNSLLERAWKNLEFLIEYLEENISEFPEWKESKYYKNCQTKYFSSAVVFQESGLIDIEYSRLTFEKLRQLIIRIEKSDLKRIINKKVEDLLLNADNEDIDKTKVDSMLENVRAFIGARVAELHTSQTTRVQRSRNNNLEYKAIIRPLYNDEADNHLNYYKSQVAYWRDEILSMLPDLGIDLNENKIDWSNEGKKIFSSIT